MPSKRGSNKEFNPYNQKYFFDKKQFKTWIDESSAMIILRGSPSKKKLMLKNKLKSILNPAIFSGDGCFDNVKSALEGGKTVMVDAPCVTVDDVNSYIRLSKHYTNMVIIPDFLKVDDKTEVKVEKIVQNVVPMPVVFYAWFLSDIVGKDLLEIGHRCLHDLWAIESVRAQLQEVTGTKDVDEYWLKQKARLHVTAKFCGGRTDETYDEKASKKMCDVTTLTLTGILLTPRTLSGHVQLQDWAESLIEDQASLKTEPHITLAVGLHHEPKQSGPDQIEVQKMILAGVAPLHTYDTSLGQARDYGECRFYVQLSDANKVPALLNAQYE